MSYALWPLFHRKVLIYEIALIKPEILIEKNEKGTFNYDDLTGEEKPSLSAGRKSKTPAVPEKPAKKNDINLLINNFKIEKGRFAYNDYLTGTSELKDLSLKMSGITLALIKPIEIEFKATANYLKKDIPLSATAKVLVDKSFGRFSITPFKVNIANESFSCPIEVKELRSGPNIEFNLSSANLSLDTLAGIFASPSKTTSAKPVSLDKSVKSVAISIPDNLKIKGSIDIKNAVYQKLKLDAFQADVFLSGKKLSFNFKNVSGYGGKLAMEGGLGLNKVTYTIKPLNFSNLDAGLFLNDFIDSFVPALLNFKNKAEGKLNVSLSLAGEGLDMPNAFSNANIKGVVVLSDGRLKNVKTLENIADKYNIPFLKQDLILKGLRVEGELKNKALLIESLELNDTDLEISFKGGLDFNSMQYKPGNRLTLKISPAASKDLPKELTVFKDERGFVNVDFELQGSLSMPVPAPRFEKPIEKTIGKLKVKIEAKRIELEQKAKENSQKEGDKLKKEARDKIKEILKF